MTISTGTIVPYSGSSTPSGFLVCDGSAVSRTTYAGLFAVIGTTYGAGDGSTTFNVPDLRGRIVAQPTFILTYLIATTDTTGGGGVTSVAMTGDGVVFNSTVSGSPITTSGTLAPALLAQTKNIVLAGPASGSNAAPTFRALVGADLPAPSASTLGGIESFAAVSHQWINAISTTGVPSASQPAFTDISGTIAASQIPTNEKLSSLGTVIDGGGFTLTTGQKGYIYCPFAGTIIAATLIANSSGSVVIDVWKTAYPTIPVDANSITASSPPTLSSAQTSQDTTLSSWTTSVAAGDVFGFNIDSVSAINRVMLSLTVVRS